MRKAVISFVLLTALLLPIRSAEKRRFYPDDPIWIEPRIPSKKIPEVKRSELLDFFSSTASTSPGDKTPSAVNANTVGGVPDSSWFTNRLSRRHLSPDELAEGPNTGDGPDITAPLIVTAPKLEGATAGFKVKDRKGDIYFVKLDPPRYPQLTTSAEVISTKFFHAFGYNVPENYLVFVRRDQLRMDPKPEKGPQLTEEDLDEVLARAPRRADGTYQLLASKKVKGEPVGTFKFVGTRPDDPNDVFAHEDRRELRGLRLFCAWLNHVDIDTINTMDVFVGEEDNGYVKHYLIDFGTTMGSGGHEPQRPRVGHEYPFDLPQISKSLFTLGLYERPWQRINYPDYPQLGNFEAAHFEPESWKADYENPAFERMTLGDAFWAAEIISRFSDEAVRAMVKTGRVDDPRAEQYLIRTLIERRNRIVAHYFSKTNPLHEFAVTGDGPRAGLKFENLGVAAGLGTVNRYEFSWSSFDNRSGLLRRLGGTASSAQEVIPLPSGYTKDSFLVADIRTIAAGRPEWQQPVQIFLARGENGWRVIGVEREEFLPGHGPNNNRFVAKEGDDTEGAKAAKKGE